MRWRWMFGVVLGGCFAEPPAEGGGEGSTGSLSSASSSSSSSTSSSSNSTLVTSGATDDDTTTTSSSGDDATSSSNSSTTTGIGSSETGSPGCDPPAVEVGESCLLPLLVEDVVPQVAPGAPVPFDMPCVRVTCSQGRALGGGFLVDNVAVHASYRDVRGDGWVVCGEPIDEAGPATWQAHVTCGVGSGDVVVRSEASPIAGGINCYDAGCPEGTHLVGGGGRWGPGMELVSSRPADDAQDWEICGSGSAGAGMIEVEAHCAVLPGGMDVSTFEVMTSVPQQMPTCIQVGCADGLLLAGGFGTAFPIEPLATHQVGELWRACATSSLAGTVGLRARSLCLED